ncbi:MAG: pimeloyl-ACP methyl esterase BioG family protein [Fusobacteriaceae bacterium]
MKLIVFFNGWGMDESIFPKEEKEWKILYVNYPYHLQPEKLKNLEELVFIGWSFGVYYANKFLEENPEFQKYLSISINGTPEMIGDNGISKKIMNYTLANLTEESIKKFYINMGCNPLCSESKNIENLKEELNCFIINYAVKKNFFKKALISQRDRIISYKNQKKYYEARDVEIKEVPGQHFIFGENMSLHRIKEMFQNEI